MAKKTPNYGLRRTGAAILLGGLAGVAQGAAEVANPGSVTRMVSKYVSDPEHPGNSFLQTAPEQVANHIHNASSLIASHGVKGALMFGAAAGALHMLSKRQNGNK
jgi:hypothetical protein